MLALVVAVAMAQVGQPETRGNAPTVNVEQLALERCLVRPWFAVSLRGGLDAPGVVSVLLPVRLTFSPFARGEAAIARSGLFFGLELAGGVVVISGRSRFGGVPVPSPSRSGLLSIGYSLW